MGEPNATQAHEIVQLIEELDAVIPIYGIIPDQTDLPPVTWLTEETFS